MSKLDELIILRGQSGTNYQFQLYELTDDLPEYGTIYALMKRNLKKRTENADSIVYVGNASNLRMNLQSTDLKDLIDTAKVNLIAIHQDTSIGMRERKARDIVNCMNPSGNRKMPA